MLHLQFSPEELPDLLKVLNRAANCWAPHERPEWLMPLADRVESTINKQKEGDDQHGHDGS